MRKVDAHRATFFYCPRCESQTFVRLVFVKRGDYFCLEPAEPDICKRCGYELKGREGHLVQNGGAVLDAWWFTCHECGRDTFVDVTIYEDSPIKQCSERPPSRGTCQACGRTYRLILVEPG